MASRIIAVKKETVPAGKLHAGEPFYKIECFVGSMMNPRAATTCVFLTGKPAIDKVITDYWDEAIKTGVFQDIDLRYVVVGDREVNPSAIPLPPYRVKRSDGTVLPSVHTSMQVLMQFENGAPVGSPRNTAIRIIETMCEPVVMSQASPEMAEGTPNPLAN